MSETGGIFANRMRGNGRNFGKRAHPDSVTRAQAEVQLAMLLAGCSDDALAAMSAEYLHRTHKVPLAVCERKLAAARQDRHHD